MSRDYDAVVVGAGPNGLAAAITLARAGCSVLVLEAAATVGGGCRSLELTLPGFVHDVCSAIHPLAFGSPFFRRLPLADYGLRWIDPPAALAHPQDAGPPALLYPSIAATGATLAPDAGAYRRLMAPLAAGWGALAPAVLAPLLRLPRHPVTLARFGVPALLPARLLAGVCFRGMRARALFGGLAAHSMLPLEQPASASFGLILGLLGHVFGWPFPQGGAQKITDALAAYLRALGGTIETGTPVNTLADLPSARAVLFDLSPRQVLRLAGDRFPPGYRRQLERFRYGPGAFKVDFALDGPIPWRAPACARAATVHLGGTLPEIAASERAVWRGQIPERPFVLLAQHSLFDSTRAPAGKHTVWAYCHVPNGSSVDLTQQIEQQIERFAPGFHARILARHVLSPAGLEVYNPNYVGGDINGGAATLPQILARPALRLDPYSTPLKGYYLCSASTPPGGGVHGLCGYWAARVALRKSLQGRA
jgi:phytoene dehydrogenase-like protein